MKLSKTELTKQLMLANILELNKRVLINVTGNELSTRVDGESVSDNAEVLITTKLRESLVLKAV